jgi:hypothetical protein
LGRLEDDSFGDGGVMSALTAAPRGGVGGLQTCVSSWGPLL